MKLLLTSNGLSNDSIADTLESLVGIPRKKTRIAFIPTAGLAPELRTQDSTKDWLVNDLYRVKEFCGFIDIISLADLPKDKLISRLESVDAIFVGGGNTFYLSYWMEKSGLFDQLPKLLETKVYVGISAGSMIATPSIRTASQAILNPDKFYDKEYDLLGPKGMSDGATAGLVDFVVRPHFNSVSFPNIKGDFLEEIAKDVKLPLYAIDDMSAIKVDGDKIEVISEGQWKKF